MSALTLADILDIDSYEMVREEYRASVIAHKRDRRLAVGPSVTLAFEDRETIRYQIQEMTRIERTRGDDKVQAEIDAYSDLVPRQGELSATLFIEIPEAEKIRSELDRLIGIDEHVWLEIGPEGAAKLIRARFDRAQLEEERISAVQYIRFEIASDEAQRFASEPSRIRIDHPGYAYSTEIPPEVRASLLRDLRGESPSLLDPSKSRANLPEPEILFESGRVRVVRASGGAGREHLVVEPIGMSPPLTEADPELLTELALTVQRVARELCERTGSCRILARAVQSPPAPLRFEIVSD